MEESIFVEIIRTIAPNGIWAILFTYLLFFTLRESSKREEKLLNHLGELSRNLERTSQYLKDIHFDIKYIKDLHFGIKHTESISRDKDDNP
ncbi:MAG: Bacteriocin UviB [candidate division WS2 bacterium]|nr:Bacteriocin UviB [Candidatus Lithacetigena glycinireducens]